MELTNNMDSSFGNAMNMCEWLQGLSVGDNDGTMDICEWLQGLSVGDSDENSELQITNWDAYKQQQQKLFIPDKEGYTELHIAIINLQLNRVVELISRAPDPECLNIKNYLFQTPLHLAVIMKLPLVVRRLIVAGASAGICERLGNSALHIASKEGEIYCAHALMTPINYYFDVTNKQLYETPLHPLPQDLEVRNFDGKTCLHLAVESFLGYYSKPEHLEIIFFLLENGADINSQDSKAGKTGLHYAAEVGNLPLLDLLLKNHRVNVNACTYGNITAVTLAAGRGHKLAVMRLLQHGADVPTDDAESCESTSTEDDVVSEFHES